MKIITIIAETVSGEALAAAIPADGIASVTVSETQTFSRTPAAVESYRGRKVAKHFSAGYRIEVAADDAAADAVIEGVAFVRSAGLLGDARAWISTESAADPFATGAFNSTPR